MLMEPNFYGSFMNYLWKFNFKLLYSVSPALEEYFLVMVIVYLTPLKNGYLNNRNLFKNKYSYHLPKLIVCQKCKNRVFEMAQEKIFGWVLLFLKFVGLSMHFCDAIRYPQMEELHSNDTKTK